MSPGGAALRHRRRRRGFFPWNRGENVQMPLLLASPDGARPLLDLFEASTSAHFGDRTRLGILRRVPLLIHDRKAFPTEWLRRNHAAIKVVRRRYLPLSG